MLKGKNIECCGKNIMDIFHSRWGGVEVKEKGRCEGERRGVKKNKMGWLADGGDGGWGIRGVKTKHRPDRTPAPRAPAIRSMVVRGRRSVSDQRHPPAWGDGWETMRYESGFFWRPAGRGVCPSPTQGGSAPPPPGGSRRPKKIGVKKAWSEWMDLDFGGRGNRWFWT